MQTGFRYRMEHIGDFFVDMIDKVAESARCSAKGVILTYDIHFLKKKRRGLINELGARVAELRKTAPEPLIFSDQTLRGLLDTLDEAEKRYDELVAERQLRLYPTSSSCCACSSTEAQANAYDGTNVHDASIAYGEPHTHEELHVYDEPHTHEEMHIHEEHHTHEELREEAHEELHEEAPHTDDEPDVHDEPQAQSPEDDSAIQTDN
ncbi:MAG: hypothetical protein L7F77_07275 [Candidatus Magnetominusculus sp. LBB02]|nr:hypothetical protein [Candidatus Magnetominusculus sp. LBB02]